MRFIDAISLVLCLLSVNYCIATIPPAGVPGTAIDPTTNSSVPALITGISPAFLATLSGSSGGASNSTSTSSNTPLYIGIGVAAVVVLLTLCAGAAAVVYFLQDGSAFRGVSSARYRSLNPSFSPIGAAGAESPKRPMDALEIPRSTGPPLPNGHYSSSVVV